ncbi:hypothetical protein [Vreelandella lutescens]|uniref:Uncharacterized protein n=1 Tax=Vreelandella lutescens TaxID=1602943 RepID=A0ABQ1NPA8_9GAMM|nr:hypothetical protein [Halomonas lutescens]GGC81275.1 hypothetical protein GCM10011382_09310 [Halomonas lutescens]
MTNRFWMPVLASMALLLSACGDSQEEAAVAPEEPSATTDQAGEPASVANESPADPPAESGADSTEDAAPSEVPSPSEVEDDIEARQAAEELEQAEAMRETDTEANALPNESLQADAETLAADPEEALDEASAMPGETTRSDVDDVIAETERRFEEAQRQLEEQFQEIEQQSPELMPMENDPIEPSWERESSLPDTPQLEGELEATDVDALIEDTERQFEEAQQRLEEQFQALENERSTNGVTDEDAESSP